MQKRAAILVESSDIPSQRDLPGARLDVKNWQKHLLSKHGGAWEPTEITVLNKPSWNYLKNLLEIHHNTDYVFITFSGHGYHLAGKDIDETRICLTSTDEVAVVSINPGNPRCTFVIDTCRGIVREEELLRKSMVFEARFYKEAVDRSVYRELFDLMVLKGERGIIRLYSCDLDEAANESSRSGGHFSRSLVDCSEDWYQSVEHGERLYYPVNSAFNCAAGRTTARSPQQHPQYEGGRRLNHFPISVCP